MTVSFVKALFRFGASYGLACVILLCLFVLTLIGTLVQSKIGLYQAQKEYFSSFIAWTEVSDNIAIPWPGGYLLMLLLGINLTLGWIMRIRWEWSKLGMIVVHGGILFLLAGGWIAFHFSIDGQMTLAEGEESNRFASYHAWEVAVVGPSGPDGTTEYIIPMSDFVGAAKGGQRRFHHGSLPFDILLEDYMANSEPRPIGAGGSGNELAVRGFYLQSFLPRLENEQNAAGLYITLRNKKAGKEQKEILWGLAPYPLTVEDDGVPWRLALRRQRWEVPFTIRLKKFTRELHPGTRLPKVYKSEILKLEGNTEQEVLISMNEPLRHKGYTFFQASFLEDPKSGQFFSTFAVVRNPADQYPLYACCIITFGLALHFLVKLVKHLNAERKTAA